MKKKHLQTISAVLIALGFVAARRSWPDHINAVQMTFVSVAVFVILIFGLWRDRRNPRFLSAVGLIVVSHFVILLAAGSSFPFRTVITLMAFVVSECIVLFIVGLKVMQ